MKIETNLAKVASAVSEPSRAAILVALLDGRLHPASELALMSGIKPQTGSFHLAKMMELNLISCEQSGRHRYYKLNPEVAPILESLLNMTPPSEVKSFKQASQTKAIKKARTCYDHFAGEFGVALTEALVNQSIITEGEQDFILTDTGYDFLNEFGINIDDIRKSKRSFSRKCLDWSERKYHLAGALGKAIVNRFYELNWVEPLTGSRAVKVTALGKAELLKKFNISIL
jgi:DNA-binding transcriptional ArsR family regulator